MNKRYLQIVMVAMAMATMMVTAAFGQAPDDDRQFNEPCQLIGHAPWMMAQVMDDDSLMPPGPPPGFRGGDPAEFAKQRKHLEQFRMLEMLKLLDLNDDQEVDFLVAFRKMRDEQSKFEQEKSDLIDGLREDISAETVTKATIDRITDQMTDLHKRRTQSMETFFGTMKQILTPEQMAKFIVFEERFEFELLKKLRGFHQRRGNRDGDGPGR